MTIHLAPILRYLVRLLSRRELRELDTIVHQRLLTKDDRTAEHAQYAYWEQLVGVWDQIPSPFRPSPGDIAIYRDFLRQAPEGPILILGATPELRELAATERGGPAYLADLSYRMPFAMLRFTQHVDPLEEIWVRANWLELPFPVGFFGAIIGDLALQQLAPETEPHLLEKIAALLKPGGAFITRCQVLDETVLGDDVGTIVARFRDRPLTDWQKVHFITSRILWRFADRTHRRLNRTLAAQELAAWANETETAHPLLGRIRQTLLEDPAAFRTWSPPEERALVTLFSQHFTVIEVQRAGDYEGAAWCPIFHLGVRPDPS